MTTLRPAYHAVTSLISAFTAVFLYDVAGPGGAWTLVAVLPVLIAVSAVIFNSAPDSPPSGFTGLEPIDIPSVEAYDRIDSIEDGRTIVEDKRDAQCYFAEPRGDGDV